MMRHSNEAVIMMTCHVASVLIKFIPKIEVNRERGKKMNTSVGI
jgi:hypothetical protein